MVVHPFLPGQQRQTHHPPDTPVTAKRVPRGRDFTTLRPMSLSDTIFPDSLSPAWVGREDGPSPQHSLWFTTITPLPEPSAADPGAALLGFASDEGVRRNHGRPGAVEGPDAIREMLGWLAVHDEHHRYDAGTVHVDDRDLEGAHDQLAGAVSRLIEAGHLPVVLGGGHELGIGSHRGLRHALGDQRAPAIVNLDAHLDLREMAQATSGTPFRQAAEEFGEDFPYTVLGVSMADNTRFLFESAAELGARYATDDELTAMSPAEAADLALHTVADREAIHLSIDLDVLSASLTPGVSSPSAVGVPLPQIRAICLALAQTGKLRLVDVAELNPSLDVDKRTARMAARLIHEITQAHLAV